MLKALNESLKRFFPLIIYIFINSLFLLKYASRQSYVPDWMVILGYVFSGCLLMSLAHKKMYFANEDILRKVYIVIGLLISVVLVFMNLQVDPNSLHVDRWSAMEITIENLLDGRYPYDKTDYLGQTSSNLPGLSLLGLPFYLLGDVGYLQVFVFGVFSFWIYKSKRKSAEKILILLLLLFSPA